MLHPSTASTLIPCGPTANAPFCSIAITPWRALLLTVVMAPLAEEFLCRGILLDAARAKGFKLCMVSNNWHRDQVMSSARELGLEAISHAMKPAPFALKAGLKRLGATADEAVLIGDQLYTDVWSGNFAGVDTILVKPQATQDLWYTQIFRIFERRALRDLPCEE